MIVLNKRFMVWLRTEILESHHRAVHLYDDNEYQKARYDTLMEVYEKIRDLYKEVLKDL